ncbi:ABC transporter family substrate-binding protein [Actinoalloteichus spitiensis]|uniref:ABC transporter family substrate-binding protein n=1 Tax=Actinoalloteichus spitiensis TaxID=252394 RepID=UPI00037CA2CE|nr:ABC transporter family substrate-binding protein [Actinoalloteichus spitiensis]
MTGSAPHRSRCRVSALLSALVALVLVAACTNTPPPPLVDPTHTDQVPSDPVPNEIVVGVDELSGGFNPHLLSDLSATTTVLASLLLPSVFRPGPGGEPRLDRSVATSARVVDADPFTVRYVLRQDASWSDGAPIAAEDFDYLWQRMRSEPGVVDSAGYRLIDELTSRNGGKVVEVTFSEPYPAWRSLFSDLLPAHLLKDAPGGWTGAFSNTFPVSGNAFTVNVMDLERGELILERNDKYWYNPASLDRLVFREASHSGLASALDSDDNQAAMLRADAIATGLLASIDAPLDSWTVPRSHRVEVLFRPASPQLSDQRVRRAVAASLDRDFLIAAGARSGPSAELRVDAQLRSPVDPVFTPTLPEGSVLGSGDPDLLVEELSEAGYALVDGQWLRNGVPFELVVAAPRGQEPYTSLAGHVARQLGDLGVETSLITPPADELYPMLVSGQPGGGASAGSVTGEGETPPIVDVAVVPRPTGGDVATELASWFGCVPAAVDGSPVLPGNPAGFCDPQLQPVIDSVLTGGTPLSEVEAELEDALWQRAVALPLFQLAETVVATEELDGLAHTRPFLGPFSSALHWRRVGA